MSSTQQPLYWETLDVEKHDVKGFSCGHSDFDRYLHDRAHRDQAYGIAQTHVLLDQEKIVAYYSIKCTNIKVDDSEAQQVHRQGDLTTVPAVEIPYIAVCEESARQGFGSLVVEEIIASVYELAKTVGCRYIFLRAVRSEEDWIIRWYSRFEFKETPFNEFDQWTVPMRYLIP